MPRLNSNGSVAMGIAGIQGSINGIPIPDARGPHWLDSSQVVFIDPSDVGIWWYDTLTKRRELQSQNAANDLLANGNTWAAWLAGFGMYTSTGLVMTDAGLLDVGPDGEIGYVVNRNNDVPINVRELDGSDWTLSDIPIAELQLLGSRRALWRDFSFNFHTLNIPTPIILSGMKWHPHAVFVQGEWWISYLSKTYGLVLHPFSSTKGYLILPYSDFIYHPDMVNLTDDVIRIAWSVTNGEGPTDYRILDTNIALQPRIELGSETEPIVRINKPCYLGMIEFIPTTLIQPSNCQMWVKEGGTIRANDQIQFGQWVQGDSVEDIEEQCRNNFFKCLAYWDGRNWPKWPTGIKFNDWLGLQAYCFKHESPAEFERNIRAIIESVPPSFKQIALVCQAYTSNLTLTNDLVSLVPVYSRLAKDYPRINFLLVFSDQGRATGLNDHPEVRPFWTELYEGITGVPNMSNGDNGVVNGVLVDPKKYWEVEIIAGEDVANYVEVYRRKQDKLTNYGRGSQNRSDCTPSSRLFMPYAGCRNVSPDPNIPKEVCLGVKQDPEAWLSTIDTVENHPGTDIPLRWLWHNPMGPAYVPYISDEPVPSDFRIELIDYDKVVRRSDPSGMLIRFDVSSPHPVVEVTLELLDDDEPSIQINFLDQPRRDGRYVRALAFKPTVNGKWTLRVSAMDNQGNKTFIDGVQQVEVIL